MKKRCKREVRQFLRGNKPCGPRVEKRFHRLWQCIIVTLALAHVTLSEELTLYTQEAGRLPLGARVAALGDAGASLAVNVASTYWNPAAAAMLQHREVCFEGAMLYGNLSNQAYIGIQVPFEQQLGIGIGYTPFFSGDIPRFDTLGQGRSDGVPQGVFTNNHHICILAVAKAVSIPLPRLAQLGSYPLSLEISIGCGFKGYWQTMTFAEAVRMGLNINCDLGIMARCGLDYHLLKKEVSRQLCFGVSIQDALPTRMAWVNSPYGYEEDVHSAQYVGLSYIDRSGLLWANWIVTVAVHRLYREGGMRSRGNARYRQSFHGGIEAEMWNAIGLRMGISDGVVTAGAGIHYRSFYIDYCIRLDRIDISPARLAWGLVF